MTERTPTPTPTLAEHNDPSRVEVHGRLFSIRKMFAIALIGSGVLTGLANYFNGHNGRPKMPAIDVNWGNDENQHGSDISGGFDVPGEDGSIIHVTDGRPGTESAEEITHTKTMRDIMGEQWARRFASDEHAGELKRPTEIDSLADRLLKAVKHGWQVDSLSVRGSASAEDDTVDVNGNRTAGLQQTSPEAAEKQEELGDKRRNIGTVLFVEALASRGVSIDPDNIELLPSTEDVLTNDEVAVIDGLARQFGYASHTTMIEQWNRNPDSVPPEVDEALIDMLAKERTFQVEVRFSKTDKTTSAEPGSESTEEVPPTEGDEGPGDEIIDEQRSESHQIRIFLFLLPGYVVVLINRRRKDGQHDKVAQLVQGGVTRAGARVVSTGVTRAGARVVSTGGPRAGARLTPTGSGANGFGEYTPTAVTETPVSGGGNGGGRSRVTPPPRRFPPPFEPEPVHFKSRNGFNPHSNGHKPAPEFARVKGRSHKQPRTFNGFGSTGRNRPVGEGGRGRMPRNRGGNRRGKRG